MIVSSLAQHQILIQHARIFRAWLPSVFYSLLFSPFLQHYHISERFQRATRRGEFSPAAGVDDQLLIKRHTGQYRGRTVLWFPTNSDHLSTVELASKAVLLYSSRMVARETSRLDVSRPLAMLMSPN